MNCMAIINNLNFIENERNEPSVNTSAAKKTFEILNESYAYDSFNIHLLYLVE
jgi:hypothetical protein